VRNPGVPVLIPAYMPGSEILALVKGLLQLGVPSIVVVDDGSGAQFEELFRDLASLDRVHVIHHAINLGKGVSSLVRNVPFLTSIEVSSFLRRRSRRLFGFFFV
jgi:glycosyltransferase involved in cell wall biosynthesis